MNLNHYTRFRAYQLGEYGASFSLSVDNHFTLIEARYNDTNRSHILWEMRHVGINRINTLHITSWDDDHCKYSELQNILTEIKPMRIEYPCYCPHTINGRNCLNAIREYGNDSRSETIPISPSLVNIEKQRLKGIDVFYNPDKTVSKSNDNSVIKFFRVGSFQILSLGDCESEEIRNRLMSDEILKSEVDVLILAHHGADNGFTTTEFLKALSPKVAICATDYDNKYGHPDRAVINMLHNAKIDYYSTKTGDVIAQTVNKYKFKVSNYISNSEKSESKRIYSNKTWYTND